MIWKYCHEQGEAWQTTQATIKAAADRKRSEAAKKRERTEDGTFQPVVDQNEQPVVKEAKGRKAKAAASNSSTATVARGDKLAKDRPDLAEKVRLGELKPAAAHRQMKKDEVAENVTQLPEGKYRVIYADPPWSYGDRQGGELSAVCFSCGPPARYWRMLLSFAGPGGLRG